MITYRFTLENGMEYSADAATMQDAIAYGKNKFTCSFSVQVDPTLIFSYIQKSFSTPTTHSVVYICSDTN